MGGDRRGRRRIFWSLTVFLSKEYKLTSLRDSKDGRSTGKDGKGDCNRDHPGPEEVVRTSGGETEYVERLTVD